MPLVMDKSKSKNGASVSAKFVLFLTEVQWDKSDLPFVQNEVYLYYLSHLNIWSRS